MKRASRPLDKQSTTYERLLHVSFFHDYYNASGFRCPDFVVVPTDHTAKLLENMKLLFRYEKSGFSVLYDSQNPERILHSLRQKQGWDSFNGDSGSWTRMTFQLVLNNPWFVNRSEMSATINPNETNFFFCNLKGNVQSKSEVNLRGSQKVKPDEELFRVVPNPFSIDIPEDVDGVEVFSLAGNLLSETEGTQQTRIELPGLPVDKYQLRFSRDDNASGEKNTTEVINSFQVKSPIAIMDLLFTTPNKELYREELFPVRNLSPVQGKHPTTEIIPTHYTLRFGTRKTRWCYHLMPMSPARQIIHAEIVTQPEEREQIHFERQSDCLGLSDNIQCFASSEELPLLERSTYEFSLKGRFNLREACSRVLIPRLPVASATKVISASQQGEEAVNEHWSNIYVSV